MAAALRGPLSGQRALCNCIGSAFPARAEASNVFYVNLPFARRFANRNALHELFAGHTFRVSVYHGSYEHFDNHFFGTLRQIRTPSELQLLG